MSVVLQRVGQPGKKDDAMQVDDALLQEDRTHVEGVAKHHDDAGDAHHGEVQPRHAAAQDIDETVDSVDHRPPLPTRANSAAAPANSTNPTQTLLPKARKHPSLSRVRISHCWKTNRHAATATARYQAC